MNFLNDVIFEAKKRHNWYNGKTKGKLYCNKNFYTILLRSIIALRKKVSLITSNSIKQPSFLAVRKGNLASLFVLGSKPVCDLPFNMTVSRILIYTNTMLWSFLKKYVYIYLIKIFIIHVITKTLIIFN